jgi:hypothetical protein
MCTHEFCQQKQCFTEALNLLYNKLPLNKERNLGLGKNVCGTKPLLAGHTT